ncbi:winged helix-turn-helix domain-containing protein [Gluconobacter sp. NFX36]|uniref:winged helix-turn-helix domain-containing protein n=1 Tax=Gluconobacter sp. NFX36 TaxID=2819535 RepID=UPI003CF3D1A1
MSARRWAKFWWQDWQRDPALRMCSLAARGAWIEILCLMADANPVGHLLVNGRAPNMRQLAAVLGCSEREASKHVSELEENGVFSRSDDGTIYSRRMVRDKAISDEASANGKKGGNPQIKPKKATKVKPEEDKGLTPTLNQEATPTLKHQEAEADTEADIHSLTTFESERAQNPKSEKSKRASRLAANWRPSAEMVEFAQANGVDPERTAAVFRDYWVGVPDPKGRKADWDATWRNWVRRDQDIRPTARPTQADRRAAVNAAWAGVPDIEGV